MTNHPFSWKLFNQMPIVGIVRNLTIDDINFLMPLYIEAGFTTIEITLNTPDALEAIQLLIKQYHGKINIGAGTVCTLNDLNSAIEAGAQFIVSPIVKNEVITKCTQLNIPIFPGAFTPTEIYEAWELGAPMIKVYPASFLGPNYISSILSPLNKIKLLPTGGINISNMMPFMKSGAAGLGIGSELFDKVAIQQRDANALRAQFELYIQQMDSLQ